MRQEVIGTRLLEDKGAGKGNQKHQCSSYADAQAGVVRLIVFGAA